MKKNKEEIRNSSITFPAGYYRENINIFNKKLTNRLFLLQTTKKFSFFRLDNVNENLT